MFKLKENDPWEEKKKKAIDRLIHEGEQFKKNSLEKWNKKANNFKKK